MKPRPSDTLPPELRQQLRAVREALLALHKALLDDEKLRYERHHGRIEGSYEFLRLVIGDPWFAWLHPMSQLVVAIDEFMASRQPVTEEGGRALVEGARALLRAESQAEGFAREYHRALRDSPNVTLLHSGAWRAAGGG